MTVKSAEATSSGTKPLRSTISRSSRSVASRISAGSSRATVVAPRIPRTITRRPRAGSSGASLDDAVQGGDARGRWRGGPRRAASSPSEIGPKRSRDQRHDRMLDDLEHPAHLPVAAFVDRDVDERDVAADRDDAQLRRRGAAFFEPHAAHDPLDRGRLEPPAHASRGTSSRRRTAGA